MDAAPVACAIPYARYSAVTTCRPQAVLYTAVFNVKELLGRHFVHCRIFAGLNNTDISTSNLSH